MIPAETLDDLCSRFLGDLSERERRDINGLLFRVERAHWFFVKSYQTEEESGKSPRTPPPSSFSPSSCHGGRAFALEMFGRCLIFDEFRGESFDALYDSWQAHKRSIPTFGAIILDPGLEFCLMVQGNWNKKKPWNFPKGKIDPNEDPVDCAAREVLEETGLDIKTSINRNRYLECLMKEHLCRLYIVPDVSMESTFEAKTTYEIKAHKWFKVEHLPVHFNDKEAKERLGVGAHAFYNAIPFVKELKVRIQMMKDSRARAESKRQESRAPARSRRQQVHTRFDRRQSWRQRVTEEFQRKQDARFTTPEHVVLQRAPAAQFRTHASRPRGPHPTQTLLPLPHHPHLLPHHPHLIQNHLHLLPHHPHLIQNHLHLLPHPPPTHFVLPHHPHLIPHLPPTHFIPPHHLPPRPSLFPPPPPPFSLLPRFQDGRSQQGFPNVSAPFFYPRSSLVPIVH